MKVVRRREDLAAVGRELGLPTKRHALVPTMGALHEGHLSLVDVARQHAELVSATIFVNPKQFGPKEDLSRYPRTEERDLEMLEARGVDLVYVPTPDDIYPEGFQTAVRVGALAEPLDGASRPNFFGGIATVVTKLFTRMRPDVGVFGEKDYQQLLVIRRLSEDLDLGVKVIGARIVREDDGLAMSSRNRYLSPPERRIAAELNVIMRKVCQRIEGGVPVPVAIAQGRVDMDDVGLRPIDYLELRSSTDLSVLPDRALRKDELADARLFAAVMLGGTRLIDNMAVVEPG
ncbi:MAG: pantoate--beta-alanine ligase [Parvularculaceae bacterium]|nr:pantoate--beta-alanine ligase [Parvularculaceae bacterium]